MAILRQLKMKLKYRNSLTLFHAWLLIAVYRLTRISRTLVLHSTALPRCSHPHELGSGSHLNGSVRTASAARCACVVVSLVNACRKFVVCVHVCVCMWLYVRGCVHECVCGCGRVYLYIWIFLLCSVK